MAANNIKPSWKVTYQKLFWLFIFASLLGVLLEGFWCLFTLGHWETHVVSIWGPYCIIYGLGAVGFYLGSFPLKGKKTVVQFIYIALIGPAVEYICSCVLSYGLHMKAWDYSEALLNIKGRVTLPMTLLWGFMGLMFIRYIIPRFDSLYEKKMQTRAWRLACLAMSIFMVLILTATTMCIVRWSDRHEGVPANHIGQLIDEKYDDARMQKRFCEWSFIDGSKEENNVQTIQTETAQN